MITGCYDLVLYFMASKTDTIYRKCACRETAFDCKWDISRKAFVWVCRNCGTLALDRRGQVREYRPKYTGPKAEAV